MTSLSPWCPAPALPLAVFDLGDYNFRVVVLGSAILGTVGGFVGTFLLLRGRALVSDPIGHATRPGIVIAFMLQVGAGGDGRNFAGLLLGGLVSALAGAGLIALLTRSARVREDAAFGVVLSLFYGGGVALMGMAQQLDRGRFSGVTSFLEGRASEMVAEDLRWIGGLAAVAVVALLAVHKELLALCFDRGFAAASRLPIRRLDALLLAVTTLVVVAGLQAVGLVLVMALLIIPPAAGRFWCDRPMVHALVAAGIGGVSAVAGAALSASWAHLPTGPLIVLCAAGCFVLSALFGRSRGVLATRSRPAAEVGA